MITIPQLSTAEKLEFLKNKDLFLLMFGEAAVLKALEFILESQLVGLEYVPLENHDRSKALPGKCWRNPNRFLGKELNHHKFYQGDWEKTVRVQCNVYLIPHQYQGLCHGNLIRGLLNERFPWLGEFTVKCYDLSYHDEKNAEFFVGVLNEDAVHAYLYVPYLAFINGDVEAIKKRNVDYLKWYTKSDEASSLLLNHPTALAFLSLVATNKETANV